MLKVELSYRGLLTLIGAVFGVWVIWHLWPVVLLILISLVLMIGLLPYVEAMVGWGVPRPLAVVLILVGILAAISVLLGALVPAMLEEFRSVRVSSTGTGCSLVMRPWTTGSRYWLQPSL